MLGIDLRVRSLTVFILQFLLIKIPGFGPFRLGPAKELCIFQVLLNYVNTLFPALSLLAQMKSYW